MSLEDLRMVREYFRNCVGFFNAYRKMVQGLPESANSYTCLTFIVYKSFIYIISFNLHKHCVSWNYYLYLRGRKSKTESDLPKRHGQDLNPGLSECRLGASPSCIPSLLQIQLHSQPADIPIQHLGEVLLESYHPSSDLALRIRLTPFMPGSFFSPSLCSSCVFHWACFSFFP